MDIPWSISFTGAEIEQYGSNCVYGWFRGEKCLYIGFSSRGLGRVLCHTKVGIVEPFQADDEVRCLWVKTEEDAIELETILIDHYGPTYNWSAGYHPMISDKPLQTLVCQRCNRTFTQKQWWHTTCSQTCEPMTESERFKDFLAKL